MEPLWWVGMTTSEFSSLLLFNTLMAIWATICYNLTTIDCFNSDCWRDSKFCCICICTSYSGHSSWGSQHYNQAWTWLKIIICLSSIHPHKLISVCESEILTCQHDDILQCCACIYYFEREAAYFWNSWLRFMCCGLHHNCSTCSSGTSDGISDRSMGSCHRAR